MDRERLVHLIKEPYQLNENDVTLFEKWVNQYPYFQAASCIYAKMAQDYNLPEKDAKLNNAALHTPDRHVLKNIIKSGWYYIENKNFYYETSSANEYENSKADKVSQLDEKSLGDYQEVNQENVEERNKELEQDLKNDYLIKKDYNDAFAHADEMPQPRVNQKLVNEVLENIERAKKLKQQYIDQDDNETTSEKKEAVSTSYLLNHSEDSEKKNDPDNKKREQISIIDNYIKNERNLSRIKPVDSNSEQKDLSEKSSRIDDDLVSENLANIMRNQGKKDKAIDIYKKLIWKFPQKRTYFAALIEELKNQ